MVLLLMLALLFFCKTGQAQLKSSSRTLQGMVMDSVTGKAIPFVTIKLLDSSNAVIKVALTNEEGNINILIDASNSVNLIVSATGYQAKTIGIPTKQIGLVIDFKNILLQPIIEELKQVVVNSKVPIIKQEVDRIIYNLQADPENRVKNTLEIMRKIPYLSMDAEENILLKGNKNFRIFINGKPSGLMESNPKDVLRSMPASTIQRIEVITNPSSKYDAEGIAGIINIVTIRKLSNGYNGSINMYHKMPMSNMGVGTSFTTKKGKWGVSGFAGVNYDELLPTNYNNIQSSKNLNLIQEAQRNNKAQSRYVGTNISFEVDSFNLITAQASANSNKKDGNDYQATILDHMGIFTQQYKTMNQNITKANGLDAAINWQIGSRKNKTNLITLSYQYLSYTNKQNNLVELKEKVNFSSPDFKQFNKGFNDEHTFQADMVRAIKKVYFETGVKGIFRNNNSDFKYLKQTLSTNVFQVDSLNTNQLLSTQNLVAVYNNFRFSIKAWSFQAGFRVEQTMINAKFVNTITEVQQRYFNIIPSISVSKEFNNRGYVNFGFSQRIKRPGINRLNPFIDRSNPNFINTGNPNLQPVVNNDIMLGFTFSQKISYNFGIGYSFSKNIDLKVSTYDSSTKITTSIFRNTGNASRLGIDYNITYPVNDHFTVALNGNLAYFWINGFADNSPIKNNSFTYYFILNAGYRFQKNWHLNAELNAISENPSGLQSKTNGFVSSSFSTSKSIWNNKLSFSVFVNNPFTKFRDNHTAIFSYNFQQHNNTREYFRSYGLSINYKFGKLNEELKRNRRGIRNNDVSN